MFSIYLETTSTSLNRDSYSNSEKYFLASIDNEIIIIDAGISFAELTMLGIDYTIPDYTYLKENESKMIAGIMVYLIFLNENNVKAKGIKTK